MGLLSGLPNTTGDREFEIFRSPTAAIQILRKGLAASAANTNGAINVWYDDEKTLRATRERYMVTQESRTFKTQSNLIDWLKTALKKIK